MRNIWSGLKILPNNGVSVDHIQLVFRWLVDYQWLCVLAFDFSLSIVLEEVLEEEEEEKKSQKKKEKKKK